MTEIEQDKNDVGWIGVDLDGTLAVYDGWKGPEHIGEPVPAMLRRVKQWRAAGKHVRIVTARVSGSMDPVSVCLTIRLWCKKHLGEILPITCAKDKHMIELWDDRCVQVIRNTGERVDGSEPSPVADSQEE